MAEAEVFELVSSSIKKGVPVALVTVLEHAGSTPGKQGSVMAVLANGVTEGSVGGGDLEFTVIRQALDCIESGAGGEFDYSLSGKGNIDMACGGDVRIYIKVFAGAERLLILGAGHIGARLYDLARELHFSVTVVDSRTEFANSDRYPDAQVINAEPAKALEDIRVDGRTYIAIATHSHKSDEEALRAAAGRGAAYVGMIGSRKKVAGIMGRMKADGFSGEAMEEVYAPMGLDIASVRPEEIAFSILSEILLLKNGGGLRHMKDR